MTTFLEASKEVGSTIFLIINKS